MIDPQTPLALGVVGMSVAALARGPIKALLNARQAAPKAGGGCHGCPSGGGCAIQQAERACH